MGGGPSATGWLLSQHLPAVTQRLEKPLNMEMWAKLQTRFRRKCCCVFTEHGTVRTRGRSRSCSLRRASGRARWPRTSGRLWEKCSQQTPSWESDLQQQKREDSKRCILASKMNAWTFCFCGFVKLTCESWEAVTWVCCDTYLGSVRSYQHFRGYRHKICSKATQPNKFMHNLP